MTTFVLDMTDDGFQFTSAADGVTFDIDGTGTPTRIGWTKAGTDDGFLFLDTNGNGRVDSGLELLGDGWRKPNGSRVVSGDDTLVVIQGYLGPRTPGPVSPDQAHLARIDAQDAVFTRLQLWRDVNHNGKSESDELETLSRLGVLRLLVSFENTTRWTDSTGNTRIVDGAFYLQPPRDCTTPPGGPCEVLRKMMEMEFARGPR